MGNVSRVVTLVTTVMAILLVVASLGVISARGSSSGSGAVKAENERDEKLLKQLLKPDLNSVQADQLPVHSDFARVMQKGIVEVLRSRESLQGRLTEDTDLLDRYPPDGIPARHVRSYLDQNERFRVAVIRSSNEQIDALKRLKGDVFAYFLSHPNVYDRIGKRFDAVMAEAIALQRPTADILTRFTKARGDFARQPGTQNRAEFERALAEYENWKRQTFSN